MNSASSGLPAALVLAKYWETGPVKTRLAVDLGQESARTIYRDMVHKLWCGLEHSALQRHLWVAQAETEQACSAWLPGADFVAAQPAGDLTPRLQTAFEHAFEQDPQRPWAAVLGTDCPAIDAAFVLEAGKQLATADVLLSPTFDGGYALLALRAPQPRLFEAMPWSTPEVLPTTLARAEELGLTVIQTATQRDLDDLHDYRQLQAEGLL